MFYNLSYPDPVYGTFTYGDPKWDAQFKPASWSEKVDLEGIELPGWNAFHA